METHAATDWKLGWRAAVPEQAFWMHSTDMPTV